MKSSIALVAALLTMSSFVGCMNAVVGSGNKLAETRNVGDFSRVHIRGSASAEIRVGPEQTVVVETDDNLIDMVRTEVQNGKLTIHTEGSYMTNLGLKVLITMPSTEGLSISGSGDITGNGLNADDLDISISGSGDIALDGTVASVNAHVTGSGDMNLSQLIAEKAKVSVTGSGDVSVCATESIDASITGSGDITYSGYGDKEPKLTERVTGSGDISRGR